MDAFPKLVEKRVGLILGFEVAEKLKKLMDNCEPAEFFFDVYLGIKKGQYYSSGK